MIARARDLRRVRTGAESAANINRVQFQLVTRVVWEPFWAATVVATVLYERFMPDLAYNRSRAGKGDRSRKFDPALTLGLGLAAADA